jgi:ABC-type multidrug transport system ATPase subunit
MSNVVHMAGVSKAFSGGGRRWALSGFDLHVGAGECVTLVGPNGSGKSTVLRMIGGLVTADSGTVSVLGQDPARSGFSRSKIGYLIDGNRALHGRLTPMESLRYLSALRAESWPDKRNRVHRLVEEFGLSEYSSTQAQRLSKGTVQKFLLIHAISSTNALWLLDEPTLALDESSLAILRCLLVAHIRAGGSALVASHERTWCGELGRVQGMPDCRS